MISFAIFNASQGITTVWEKKKNMINAASEKWKQGAFLWDHHFEICSVSQINTQKHIQIHAHTHTYTHICWNWAFGLFLESSKFLVVTKPSCSNKACSYKDNCVLAMTTIESCWHLNYKINILLYHSLTKLKMGLLLLENLWETTLLALLQPGKKLKLLKILDQASNFN